MKKQLGFLAMVVLILGLLGTLAFSANPIYTDRVFNAEALTAGGSATSSKISMYSRANLGYFSVQYTITGSGTVTIAYAMSNDGAVATTDLTFTTISSGLTTATGQMASFEPEPGLYLYLKITESGGVSAAAVTVDLFIQ